METFKNIDWNPSLDDLVDDVFIHDERMERESAMYRIMSDNFTDPFKDIESEYADVDIELIKKYLREDGDTSIEEEEEEEEEEEAEKEEKTKNNNNCMQEQQTNKSYVPGIRKLPCQLPRKSRLNKIKQALCLRVLLRLSNNENKGLSKKERVELEEYMSLQNNISEEQKEFLEFVKSKWDNNFNWSIKSNKYVVWKWKAKMKKFQTLPRYYIESTNIPLSVQKIDFTTKNIRVKFESYLRRESLSKMVLPKLDRPCMLNMNPDSLFASYPLCATPDKVKQHFRLPVSEDTHCESLAIEAKVDLVISSSGLKCLLDNIDPNYSNSWTIPVVVKSHRDKNVIYIDKRLPPTIATVPQKNTWVYKYILRHYFVSVGNTLADGAEEGKLEKPAARSDSDMNYSEFNDLCNDHLKTYEEALYSPYTKESKRSDRQNATYTRFTIGPIESQNHEQMKHNAKKYRMLVRTKTDGVETLPNGELQPLILAPKMEHQLAFGAEAITLEEGLHQWASLIFRPKTSLARVRIATDTAEVIQIERPTTTSLSNEIKRLYNVRVEDSLSILHNVIEVLSSLTPGRYIMRHVPQNGPFAYVYKQVEEFRKDVFDLREICQPTTFQTLRETPWPPIDNMTTTPAIRCFQKMPAMFHAPFVNHKCSNGKTSKTLNPKKGISVNKQAPRRSVRLKERTTK